MTSTTLHQTLMDLHRELAQTPELDEKSQALLETVLKDIGRTLEQNLPQPPDIVDSLENSALSFELRHPALAAAAQQLAELLRKAGV